MPRSLMVNLRPLIGSEMQPRKAPGLWQADRAYPPPMVLLVWHGADCYFLRRSQHGTFMDPSILISEEDW